MSHVSISEEALASIICALQDTGEEPETLEYLYEVRKNSKDVNWAAPKNVGDLVKQLLSLDPDTEVTALLKISGYKDGEQIRSVPLSISWERLEGPWLGHYKGEGRKVLAFWSKPDTRCQSLQSLSLYDYTQDKGVIGYARPNELAPLFDVTMSDGSYINIGLDHPGCWEEEPSYDHLIPVYAYPQHPVASFSYEGVVEKVLDYQKNLRQDLVTGTSSWAHGLTTHIMKELKL